MIDYTNYTDSELRQLALAGDTAAEEELIERYAKLVRVCARPYFLAGGDSEDLMQEGMLGLLSAIRNYDESGGASFRTFAEICIRNRVLEAVKAASRKSTNRSMTECHWNISSSPKNPVSALRRSRGYSGAHLRNRFWPERAKKSSIPRFHGVCPFLRPKCFSIT